MSPLPDSVAMVVACLGDRYNATNFFGLLVGFAGGVMYGVTKVLAKMAQNAGNSGLQRTASAKSADGMASNSKPQPV